MSEHSRKHSSTEPPPPDVQLDSVQASLGRVSAELDQSERLMTIGTLAAGVLHEVANILTPVMAYAQLAIANAHDHELHLKALHKVVHGVESATRISESILGFAGSDETTECDVAHAVTAAMNCLGRDPNKDQIDCRVEIQPGTAVRMNALSLQQVLMNLILNARAAMQDAPGRMNRLTIAAITRADGTVGIRVADTGPGISPEIAGRIFEPFVTTRQGHCERRGTGLGLAVCKRLIEQAGGTITATSSTGKGATFLIVLPSPKPIRAKAG